MTNGLSLDDLQVLVLDDNQHMRSILVSILRAVGVKHVVEAGDAFEALQDLQTHPIGLVLADLQMQGLDGIEFVKMVRRNADSRRPQVPIVMITGHSEKARVEAARDAGVSEFVVKPVSIQVLMARIQSALSKPREFVAASSYVGPDRRRRPDTPAGPKGRRKNDIGE